jgi:glycosyltransferase involved in cell wall biosynthesis
MIDVHRRRGTWIRDVDRFIALTDFARERFLAAGLPAARLAVKPNGIADLGPPVQTPRRGILFVGRLSEEKGIRVLAAAAARTRAPVQVIGDGPLAGEVQGLPNLELLGRMEPEAVRQAMLQAAAIVVPSICYEGLPTVIAEAFAAGTAVVASRVGAMPALVAEGETGLLAEPGDPAALARALDLIHDNPAAAVRMGAAGRAVFERSWTEDVVTARALEIYREAIAERAADPSLAAF